MSWKVWVEIEEYDEETDTMTECDVLDFASSATFDTIEEAIACANHLHMRAGAAATTPAISPIPTLGGTGISPNTTSREGHTHARTQ